MHLSMMDLENQTMVKAGDRTIKVTAMHQTMVHSRQLPMEMAMFCMTKGRTYLCQTMEWRKYR